MPQLIDISGIRFGRLLAIEISEYKNDQGQPKWECLCDCGETHYVVGGSLRNGTVTSCGCGKIDRAEHLKKSHGQRWHHLYATWLGMRDRCNNPNAEKYKYYGARGIKVCERWNDFQLFLDDMEKSWKPGLTIDRENNDGNYDPDNCRWATPLQQTHNRRPWGSVSRNLDDGF